MLTGVTPNANVEVYINLDCMPYIKDNAPPFNMIALLLYTDAILTHKHISPLYECVGALFKTITILFNSN